ncbi:MAG: ATP-binding protein, partial [Anaerolineales bacterium]
MPEPIEEILKKTGKNMSKGNTPISSSTKKSLGDPNCPHCGGLGYVRAEHPVGHPDFGKLTICTCRNDEISQYSKEILYSFSQLDELVKLTFDSFKPRGHIGLRPLHADSLENAFNLSKQYARSLNGWLIIHGPVGCGKTHLAAAISNFVISLGIQTIFLTVPDLLDSLRFSYDNPNETFEDKFNKIKDIPLLVLDDFGTENATDWAQEKLFQILNFRYINKLPLVVTSNLSLIDIEERIQSRLDDPELVSQIHIQAPDYRKPLEDLGDHNLSSLNLHTDQTFVNFDLRKNEKIAVEH